MNDPGTRTLRLLLLEDDPHDAELILNTLRAPDGQVLAVNRQAASILGSCVESLVKLEEIVRCEAYVPDGRRAGRYCVALRLRVAT